MECTKTEEADARRARAPRAEWFEARARARARAASEGGGKEGGARLLMGWDGREPSLSSLFL